MEHGLFKGPTKAHRVEKSLGEYFWDVSEQHGDRIFQIDADSGESETFKEARIKAVRVALHLKQNGIKPKDIILVCCDNILQDVTPSMAALFLGAYAGNMMATTDTFGAKNVFSDIPPKVLFIGDNKLDIIKPALDDLNLHPLIYVIGKSDPIIYENMDKIADTPVKEENDFKPEKVDIQDTAFILFSSGTTGQPKGILISHFTVLGLHMQSDMALKIVIDESMVQIVPLCYISSIWVLACNILYAFPKVVGSNICGEKLLQVTKKYKVFNLPIPYDRAVNVALLDDNIINKYNLEHVKHVSTIGSYVHPKYLSRLRKIFPNAKVVSTYASTELGIIPFTWTLPSSDEKEAYETKIDSVGKVNINCEVKIVDVDSGKPLGPNEKGEILVKSPYKMSGYYNQAKQPFDKDGFLHTGDLGLYDDQGYFYLKDRINRSFKYKGVFYYPGLVEDRLTDHPAVKAAAVIELPHDIDGYRALACVVLKENCVATGEELGDFIALEMQEYYRPAAGFKFLKELPVTNYGKIAIAKLKEMYKTEFGIA